MKNPSLPISLFETVLSVIEDPIRVIKCTKLTLVHISHVLEEVVLSNRLPALMFTGFQESTYWAQETNRYRELISIAKQVCIFAGKPLPDDSLANAIQIQLRDNDPLRQEWFVLILSEQFSVLLCGRDNESPKDDDPMRQFDTILSFDPPIINRVITQLEAVITSYRPELLDTLSQAHESYKTYTPNLKYITIVVNEMIRFETDLNQIIAEAHANQIRVNAELQNQRDFNQLMIENSPSLMAMSTLDGTMVMLNPALERLLQIDAKDIIGTRIVGTLLPLDVYHKFLDDQRRGFMVAKVPIVELRMTDKSGRAIDIEWYMQFIDDTQGNHQYLLGIGNDITSRKHLEQLQREQDSLRIELRKEREMSDIRSNFMTTVSHEFRTPLSIILTATELLEHHYLKESPPEVKTKLERVKQQVFRLNQMVNDISQIVETTGKTIFNPTPVDMLAFCQNLIQEVVVTKGQTHIIEWVTSQWHAQTVLADTVLLKRILVNLLLNALKFSPPASVIRIELAQDSQEMLITIADQGIGIPKEDQKRLFTPFHRGSNVAAVGGMGLGLRIVADSIDAYGGTLDYTTGENGTSFFIRLPLLDTTPP